VQSDKNTKDGGNGAAAVRGECLPSQLPRVIAVGGEMTRLVGSDRTAWAAIGCRVTCVQTCAEALRELLNHRYAVALVSAKLPDLSSAVFLEELALLAPSTAVATTAPLPAHPAGLPHALPPSLEAASLQTVVARLLAGGATSGSDLLSAIMHSLNHVEDAIVDTSRTQDALGSVCLELADLAGSDAVALYLAENAKPCLLMASQQPLDAGHVQDLTREIGANFTRFTRLPAHFPASPQLIAAAKSPPLPPFAGTISVPLLADHQIQGILCAAFTTATARARCQPATLFHLSNHAVLIYQEVRRVRNMAAHDLLTGLYNRSMFTESLKQTFSLAQRKRTPISLLLFDLDNLKSINDQYGHLAGDKALREAASLTLATARTSDIVARFGGDEFAILLPETSLPDAQQAAERLLAAFRERQFGGSGHRLRITLSIGVATLCPTKDTSSQTLFSQADEGLLAAKRSGKDRACGAPSAAAAAAVPGNEPAPPPVAAADTRHGRVLVLDDDPAVLQVLGSMLRMMRFDVVACATLKEALLAIETGADDFDLVLTDLHLGNDNGNGIDLLQALKTKAPWTVNLVVSAYASKETAIECLRHGAFDFVEKPFSYEQLSAALDRAMEHRRLLVLNQRYQNQLEGLVRSRSESLANALETLRRSYSQTIQTMALMIDARDGNTGMHCRIAREAVRLLARQMNISHHDLETIEMGAVLHDIGKLGIPDAILQKPGPLTDADLRIMRTHPRIGYDLLIGVPFLHDVAEIVLQHHEAFDGSGYPAGLKGDQICIGARIFSVIDAYHAMRSTRCYRPAMTEEAAYSEIIRYSGRQFDPSAVAAFLTCRPEIEAAFAMMQPGA
jgi:diguanylate cyclase (GGDEF)-like protein